jgi:hypothetical protein
LVKTDYDMNLKSSQCVTTVDDDFLIGAVGAAQRRIVFMAPGASKGVANALAKAWVRLGGNAVSVILDVDAEVCRMGYGDVAGLKILQEVASKLGQTLCHEKGSRIGLLIIDDGTVVYSPTPLLIEAQPASGVRSGQQPIIHDRPRPNAVVLGQVPSQLADELGVGSKGAVGRSLGLDAVKSAEVNDVQADLDRNPPLKFDVARYERVFNARIEFVELEVQGCSVSRHTASIPSDLIGLADDTEAANRLRSVFKVISENDTVDAEGKLSEAALKAERKRITDEFLISLPNFGTVILRKNRPEFEKEIEQLKEKVAAFGEGLKGRLAELIETNVAKLVTTLLPKVLKAPPAKWKKLLGASPSEQQCRIQLTQDLRAAFGSAEELIKEMKVSFLFKGVTYQTLTDSAFRSLVEQKLPGLELMHEYDAARGKETADVDDGDLDDHS